MSNKYSEKELAYLKDYAGIKRISVIANNLNRPELGIALKLKRLGLGNTKEAAGMLTTGELANLLKVDRGTIKYWRTYCGLKSYTKISRNTRKFYFIKAEEFWEWAYNNQYRIDFSRIERLSIPPEPDWVEPLRSQKSKKDSYKVWTTKELHTMVDLINNGESYKKVAMILDRSEISIARRYKRYLKTIDNDEKTLMRK
ncbi:DNA-binding protein [Peribacillus asahii]|uniref:DNA-binding protein n=1 Tax=Peribacillus asahii TaxID=228899 RepID=UPI00382813D6